MLLILKFCLIHVDMFRYCRLPNTGGGGGDGSLIEFHLLGKIISIKINTCTTLQHIAKNIKHTDLIFRLHLR